MASDISCHRTRRWTCLKGPSWITHSDTLLHQQFCLVWFWFAVQFLAKVNTDRKCCDHAVCLILKATGYLFTFQHSCYRINAAQEESCDCFQSVPIYSLSKNITHENMIIIHKHNKGVVNNQCMDQHYLQQCDTHCPYYICWDTSYQYDLQVED